MRAKDEIIAELELLGDPGSAEGMARFGIGGECVYGVRMPALRRLARDIGTDHRLALELWDVDCRETRLLAGMVADPEAVTPELMDRWARDFDGWELCDQTCMNLFDRTRYNYQKAVEWSTHRDQFVKRAAFALIAQRAVRDVKAPDRVFLELLPLVEAGATDGRPYVTKGVSWALRQIGKRNAALNRSAVEVARRLKGAPEAPARRVGAEAYRELTDPKVRARLKS